MDEKLTKPIDVYDGPIKIEKKFAWGPVLIRNRIPIFGIIEARWVIFKTYTRVWGWDKRLNRYRTFDTYLGKPNAEQLARIEAFYGETT